MSETQKPPEPHATWLDYVLDKASEWLRRDLHNVARAELAALRKELETTKGLLAQQTKNTMEALKQREEARKERDEALTHNGRLLADSLVVAKDLGEARAKLAELREAALALGEIEGTDKNLGLHFVRTVHFNLDRAVSWNEVVAKLRADAATKEPQ